MKTSAFKFCLHLGLSLACASPALASQVGFQPLERVLYKHSIVIKAQILGAQRETKGDVIISRYKIRVLRILNGQLTHKPKTAIYRQRIPVLRDPKTGKVIGTYSPIIPGSGLEGILSQGKTYYLISGSSTTAASEPLTIIRAEPIQNEKKIKDLLRLFSESVPTHFAKAERALAADGAFACGAPADCVNSCIHGAVNRLWFAVQYPGGEACQDGCTSKGTGPAQCINASCVAFYQGGRAKECTKQEGKKVLKRPGPAHRCSTDKDCVVSCAWGAVNRSWYSMKETADCDGGCAQSGDDTAHCRENRCVSDRGGKPNPECSGRSIHSR